MGRISPGGELALGWSVTIVGAVVVGLRVFVRQRLGTLGNDDYLMILAVLSQIANLPIGEILLSAGFYLPTFVFINEPYHARLVTIYAFGNMLFATTILTANVSVGLLIQRILGIASIWRNRFITVVLIGYGFVTFLYLPVQVLQPCEYNGLPLAGTCMDPEVYGRLATTFNVYTSFVNIVFSTLPAAFIWKSNSRLRKKLTLSVLLSLGWLAAIFTLLREIYSDVHENDDLSHDIQIITTWLENGVTVICGSLGSIAPLFKYWKIWFCWGKRNDPETVAQARAASQFERPAEFASIGSSDHHPMRQARRLRFLPSISASAQRTFDASFPSGSMA